MSKSSGRKKVDRRKGGATQTDAEIAALLAAPESAGETIEEPKQENVVLGDKAGSDKDGLDFDFDNVFKILKLITKGKLDQQITAEARSATLGEVLLPYIVLTSTRAYQSSPEGIEAMGDKEFAIAHHADVIVSMLQIAQRLVPSIATDIVPVYKSLVSQTGDDLEADFRSSYAAALVGFSSYTTLTNATATNRISVARLLVGGALAYARLIAPEFTLREIHKIIVNAEFGGHVVNEA